MTYQDLQTAASRYTVEVTEDYEWDISCTANAHLVEQAYLDGIEDICRLLVDADDIRELVINILDCYE